MRNKKCHECRGKRNHSRKELPGKFEERKVAELSLEGGFRFG